MNRQKTDKKIYEDKEFFKQRPQQIMALIQSVAPIMNELHQVNHSERFWLRLLSLHLRSCVGQKPFMEKSDFIPKVPLQSINSFSPIDYKQIMLDYLMYIGRSIKHYNKRNKILDKVSKGSNICIGPRGKSISKYIGGIFVEDYYPLMQILRLNLKSRKRLKKLAYSQPDVFTRNVLLGMPKIFVEYFDKFYNPIKVKNSSKKCFHYEHSGGIFMNFLMAKYQEAGSKLIAYQTGGFMGEVENHPDCTFYYTIDELRTYGWKQHPKDVPYRAFRLEEYAMQWKKLRSGSSDYDILIVFSVRNEVTQSHYSKFIRDFFPTINTNKYHNIIVRPRPISRQFSNKKEAKKIGVPKNVFIDNGTKKIADTAAKSKLVIQVWMPATNFLECLAVDQPVMAIDTNDRPSKIYQLYSKDLYKLGILHKDTPSLVDFLNQLDDIDRWWESVLNDASYKEFKQMFCGETT